MDGFFISKGKEMRFGEYYEYDNQPVNEATLGQIGKGFLRLGKNMFGKRVAGVSIDSLNSLNKFDRSAYNYVQGVLSKNFMKKNKKNDKVYIKNVFKGEIDDAAKKLGGYENIKDYIKDISIYQTNKFGRVVLIHLQDGEAEDFYIGATWRGDANFKDLFGVWPNALTSRLNRRMSQSVKATKKPGPGPEEYADDLNFALSNPAEFLKGDTPSEVEPEDDYPEDEVFQPYTPPEKTGEPIREKIGLIDINDSTMNELILHLKQSPSFKNQFKRRPFESSSLDGYEYIFPKGNGSMFIMNYKDVDNDDEQALMVFSDKNAYKYADRLGIINFPYTKAGGGGGNLRNMAPQWEDYADVGADIFDKEI